MTHASNVGVAPLVLLDRRITTCSRIGIGDHHPLSDIIPEGLTLYSCNNGFSAVHSNGPGCLMYEPGVSALSS